MVMKYNTVGYLGFTVDHEEELHHVALEPKDIRNAIFSRLVSMTDDELFSEIDWGETIDNE